MLYHLAFFHLLLNSVLGHFDVKATGLKVYSYRFLEPRFILNVRFIPADMPGSDALCSFLGEWNFQAAEFPPLPDSLMIDAFSSSPLSSGRTLDSVCCLSSCKSCPSPGELLFFLLNTWMASVWTHPDCSVNCLFCRYSLSYIPCVRWVSISHRICIKPSVKACLILFNFSFYFQGGDPEACVDVHKVTRVFDLKL